MLLTAQHPINNSYPVEASGWDRDQSFFVEKSELEWKEEDGKFLTLSHSLHSGALIFLRLLQPPSADRSFPVAYQARHVGVTADGQQRYRLHQIPPRGDSEDQG